jgi:hypothetical protein
MRNGGHGDGGVRVKEYTEDAENGRGSGRELDTGELGSKYAENDGCVGNDSLSKGFLFRGKGHALVSSAYVSVPAADAITHNDPR